MMHLGALLKRTANMSPPGAINKAPRPKQRKLRPGGRGEQNAERGKFDRLFLRTAPPSTSRATPMRAVAWARIVISNPDGSVGVAGDQAFGMVAHLDHTFNEPYTLDRRRSPRP